MFTARDWQYGSRCNLSQSGGGALAASQHNCAADVRHERPRTQTSAFASFGCEARYDTGRPAFLRLCSFRATGCGRRTASHTLRRCDADVYDAFRATIESNCASSELAVVGLTPERACFSSLSARRQNKRELGVRLHSRTHTRTDAAVARHSHFVAPRRQSGRRQQQLQKAVESFIIFYLNLKIHTSAVPLSPSLARAVTLCSRPIGSRDSERVDGERRTNHKNRYSW